MKKEGTQSRTLEENEHWTLGDNDDENGTIEDDDDNNEMDATRQKP
jgi:hypothetical protein